VEAVRREPGLLVELASRRVRQVLVGLQESAGERPLPGVRRLPALDRERLQLFRTHRQDDEVDRDGDRGMCISRSHEKTLPP
jgi:hypothetical protein